MKHPLLKAFATQGNDYSGCSMWQMKIVKNRHMKNVIKIIAIFFVLSLFSVCSLEQSEPIVPKIIKVEKQQKQLVLADNRLGYDIYNKIRSIESQNSNILISPIGLNKSLGIILFGTENDYSIRNVLQLYNVKKEMVYSEIEQLSNTIFKIDKQSEFKNDTRFLTHNKNLLTKGFKKFLKAYKISEIDYLDTDNSKEVYDNLLEESFFNIENEILLQCNLKYQTGVTESPFYLTPDKSKFVEMLVCESEFNFYSDNIIKAIEIPLGRGNFNALIILPGHNQSLQTVKTKFGKNYINRIHKNFRKLSLSVHIPKLDIDYNYSLNKSMHKYGIDNLFSFKAKKYENICENKELFLNNLSQSVHIKILSKPLNNQTFFEGEKKASFFVDHPFLLIVTEKYSSSIVFIGQIVNPMNL